MAAATLTLNRPKKVTLEVVGTNLREVIVPAGTRYLEYRSASTWYYEVDTGQNDADAGTAANQQAIDAGTSAIRMPGSGAGRANLPIDTSLFLAGSNSGEIWLTATSRGV